MQLHFPDEPPIEDSGLADYAAPPVIEVTLGYQFEPALSYNSLMAADFWDRVSDKYPVVEEHSALDPVFETFGANDGAIPNQVHVEFVSRAPQPRFFFRSERGSELLQFQRDRLHFNWRGFAAEEPYPRYPAVRSRFEEALAEHDQWSRGIEWNPRPTQAEIAYINRVPLIDGNGDPCGLSQLFPWLAGLPGTTETGAFNFKRRLLDKADRPVARLHFSLQYGTDDRGDRAAQLMFLVRGLPHEVSRSSCLDFLDEGRKVIVNTFTSMTSSAAHARWERQA